MDQPEAQLLLTFRERSASFCESQTDTSAWIQAARASDGPRRPEPANEAGGSHLESPQPTRKRFREDEDSQPASPSPSSNVVWRGPGGTPSSPGPDDGYVAAAAFAVAALAAPRGGGYRLRDRRSSGGRRFSSGASPDPYSPGYGESDASPAVPVRQSREC
jgi:hypothetical protein